MSNAKYRSKKAKTGRKWHGEGTPDTYRSTREEIVAELYRQLKVWEGQHTPEEIAELIAAHCDKYHGANPRLIAMQDNFATDVDAHGAWRERGRTNIGSDVGIKIVSPAPQPWCKTCGERRNHANHPGGHAFEPFMKYFYDTVYDIRHTIPDTAKAREAWRDEHPADLEGHRHWDDADDYRDYEQYGAIL